MSDWAEIKTEYICGSMSYRALAERHGLSRSAVEQRGAKEGWAALRRDYLQKTVTEAVDRCRQAETGRISRLVTAAGLAADTVIGAFEDRDQFYRYLVTEPNELGVRETQEKLFKKLDTKALKEATGILKELSGILREACDLPTAAELTERQLALEKLELQRKKLSEESGETRVELVFGDRELRDWSE